MIRLIVSGWLTLSSTRLCKPCICHLRFRMVTLSFTSSYKPCMSLTFQDGYTEFHEFLQTFFVTYVSGWWHRVPRVYASHVGHLRLRMVTSNSTSSYKPCVSFTFQDGYTEFHEFLQTLSVTYVSGWLHRVPRVLQDMCVTSVSGWLHRVPRILQALSVTYV